MAKKTVKKAVKKAVKLATPDTGIVEVDCVETRVTKLEQRLDRIVAAISKAKSVKGL